MYKVSISKYSLHAENYNSNILFYVDKMMLYNFTLKNVFGTKAQILEYLQHIV